MPLDLRNTLSGNTFIRLLSFIKNLKDSTLHILRVKPNNEYCPEEINDTENITYFLDKIAHKYHIIKNIPTHFAIDGYIQLKAIDFTALMIKKESTLERFFKSSSIAKINKLARTPLLILHSN